MVVNKMGEMVSTCKLSHGRIELKSIKRQESHD